MKRLRKLIFGRKAGKAGEPPPECPADWNLTLDNLLAELKAGKRKSVGNPEARWAREYEQSLIPADTRFPQKGDLYESKKDQTIQFMTAWAAPFTGGGEGILFKGECIWVHDAPLEDRPLGTYALPVEYKELEERMVPKGEREDRRYIGFYFFIKTTDLNVNFTLIATRFEGKTA